MIVLRHTLCWVSRQLSPIKLPMCFSIAEVSQNYMLRKFAHFCFSLTRICFLSNYVWSWFSSWTLDTM
jgi:hypothetical protein